MGVLARAKFRCDEETNLNGGQRRYKFSAVYDTSTPENKRFTQATPWGSFEMTVTNPSLKFELGQFYYIDFTPEVEATALPVEE